MTKKTVIDCTLPNKSKISVYSNNLKEKNYKLLIGITVTSWDEGEYYYKKVKSNQSVGRIVKKHFQELGSSFEELNWRCYTYHQKGDKPVPLGTCACELADLPQIWSNTMNGKETQIKSLRIVFV